MRAVDRLRVETEPDKFCCSHRCTSFVRPGQGRARVCARARSAISLGLPLLGSATFPAVHAFTAIGFRLKLSNLGHFLVAPRFYELAVNDFSLWSRYVPIPNPTLYRSETYFQNPGRLSNGIALHVYNVVVRRLSRIKWLATRLHRSGAADTHEEYPKLR